MFTMTVSHTSNPSGRSQIVAKGHGKQRTVDYNQEKSIEWNFGAGAGALLNVIASPEQQAKLRHPSAKGRITVTQPKPEKMAFRWSIDV